MRDLVSTWTSHIVSVDGVEGEVRVETATFKTAAEILAAQQALAEGDHEGWHVMREACEDWLPPELAGALFAAGQDPAETVEAILALLSAGVEDEETHEERQEEAEADARRTSWTRLFSDFCAFYGPTPEEALRIEWPLWLSLYSQLPTLRAREQLRQAQWYAGAKTNGMDPIMERAQLEDTRPQGKTPWEAEGITKEEYERRLRSRARRVQKQWMRKEAEA